MPDLRTNKSIAERFDVEINKRPEPAFRRWRRIVAWSCLAVPLVLAGFYELLGDGSAYWSSPLTDVHQAALSDDRTNQAEGCAACHTHTGQPLWRLVSGSKRHSSVADESCLQCHFKSEGQDEASRIEKVRLGHNALMLEQTVLGCGVCHEEHRGSKIDLKRVADAHCTACHAALKTLGDEHRFFDRIASFAAHPEFAASRFRQDAVIAGEAEISPHHSLFSRVELQGQRLVDKTPLHFNHEAHVRDRVLLAGSQPDGTADESHVETDARNLRWEKLQCDSCHKVDAGGEYMAPVTFAQHCSRCHPLAYSERLSSGGLGPLSHLELSKVFVEAKGRLRDHANKQLASPKGEPSDDLPRLPSKSAPASLTAGSVDELVNQVWPDVKDVITSGCAHCHVLGSKETAGGLRELAVVAPKIPSRWMPHSRFRHDRHEKYACISCHDPEAHQDEKVYLAGEDGDFELPSRQTADILMPSVAVCQKCHVKGSTAEWKTRASADCVECHDYHPPSHAR